jgi:Icc-related predicted phosphoesterase
MKALISSDIHGKTEDFESYAKILRDGSYDIGILAGDILDDSIATGELEHMFSLANIDPDELVPELIPADINENDFIEQQLRRLRDPDFPLMRALRKKEDCIREILRKAGKPIYLIPGNHDLTDWDSDDLLINIHRRRVDLGVWNLVGYRWTRIDRHREDHIRDMIAMSHMIDRRTVLVSHEPPYGILDSDTDDQGDTLHKGSKELAKMVGIRQPAWHLFGHVHRSFGRRGRSINAAFRIHRNFVSIDLVSGRHEMISAEPIPEMEPSRSV